MRIGLIADSHDNMPLIARAVARCNEAGVDLVLHAGDLIAPFTASEFQKLRCPLLAVFGNNDGEHRLWKERIGGWGEIFEGCLERVLDGKVLLLLHEPDNLDELIESQRYDIIVYGHTHQVDERTEGRTLIINPGECGGWLTGRSTMAFLELPEKKVTLVDLK